MKILIVTLMTLLLPSLSHAFVPDQEFFERALEKIGEKFEGNEKLMIEMNISMARNGHMKAHKVNRDVGNFEGDSLVVGAGWNEDYIKKKSRQVENFSSERKEFFETTFSPEVRYTIDPSAHMQADWEGDFTSEEGLAAWPDHRFRRIYLEMIPCHIVLISGLYENLKRLVKPGGKIYLTTGMVCKRLVPIMLRHFGLTDFTYVEGTYVVRAPSLQVKEDEEHCSENDKDKDKVTESVVQELIREWDKSALRLH